MVGMDVTQIIYTLIALVIGMTLHEAAHAFVGHYLGDETAKHEGRLSLNPLVHIDPVMTLAMPVLVLIATGGHAVFGAAKPVPFKPWALRYGKWGAAMVAAAGPAMNFVIAITAALWFNFLPGPGQLLITIVFVNLSFGIFNLIPIPPLDGSRVLYAAVPYEVREVMDSIERMGIMVILLILFIGFPVIEPALSAAVGGLGRLLLPGVGF
jgi:Zn-dependent protease